MRPHVKSGENLNSSRDLNQNALSSQPTKLIAKFHQQQTIHSIHLDDEKAITWNQIMKLKT